MSSPSYVLVGGKDRFSCSLTAFPDPHHAFCYDKDERMRTQECCSAQALVETHDFRHRHAYSAQSYQAGCGIAIRPKDCVAAMGSNGAGAGMLFLLLLGMLNPTGGGLPGGIRRCLLAAARRGATVMLAAMASTSDYDPFNAMRTRDGRRTSG